MFINSINNFRSIAIIFIVIAHMLYFAGFYHNQQEQSLFVNAFINIIAGGTTLFVFISGFMFHHVFYKNFNFLVFIKKKSRNILSPYIILGVIPVFLYVYLNKDIYDGYFLPASEDFYSSYIEPVFKYYWTGAFLLAYWYIPFILMMFILSPLHYLFASRSFVFQVVIIFLLFFISILVHRPIDNLSVFQSVIYYTPIYLYGIVFSMHKEFFYRVINKHLNYILLFIVVLAFLQASLGQVGNYHKELFSFGGIDLLLIQKFLMCNFFAVWLHKYECFNNKYITLLASTSFTVFFLHPFFIWGMEKSSLNELFGNVGNDYSWTMLIISVFFVIVLCVATAVVIKRLVPKYSRYLIGY